MAGKFGAISKAYCKQDLDTQVIVKVFNLENITSHLFLVIQDLVIFSKTNHSNICKLKNVLCHNNKLYLVLDYVECMTLSDYVLDQGKLIEDDALTIISQLLNVLHYFNSKNIAHRDFKPDNILINPDNLQIKLWNFEFSTTYEDFKNMKTKLGNQYFMAPEIFTRNYNQKCDIWSIGWIAYFLQTGFPPFLADSALQVKEKVMKYKLNFLDEDWESKSPESLAFIRKALTMDPNYRLTIANALDHPWITRDSDKMVNANPQDYGIDIDSKNFDIFLREIFSILIENFDIQMLESLRDTMVADKSDVIVQVIINDILSIIENTETYDDSIKELLREGLKQFNTSIDIREFLESAIEEKYCTEHKEDILVLDIEEDTAGSTEDTNSGSYSPIKVQTLK